ncbi:shikimate kinase [Deinococcus petrolearius]|uniref:Shikimate kinase n=1 Tax=Deinococcus petrolearius TaxID=1751295 RepID=A0ABW1DJ53_9DEIO
MDLLMAGSAPVASTSALGAEVERALQDELRADIDLQECPVSGVIPAQDDSSRLSGMSTTGLIERPVSWVALAGFMGTGKSRIGWELSRALALHFVDTDKLITRVVGKSIPEVFAEEGEGYFRACEREVVGRVTRLDHAVISLGGGTFIHEENRHSLLERGPVVVLWATPETVYQRTKHSDRPLLSVEDPLARIRTLMDEREGVYRQGTIHVHSDGRPSEEIVAEVIERLWHWSDLHVPGDWSSRAAD